MDGTLFNIEVSRNKYVREDTQYLEMFQYSDPAYNTVEEHPLDLDQIEDFLNQQAEFAPSQLPAGAVLVSGVRLILQTNATHPETFTPQTISLPATSYISMVQKFRLPYQGIECSSLVGAFFWSSWDQELHSPHLQIIFRKADSSKEGYTRGWELLLSHDLNTGITTGYCKCTPNTVVINCIPYLKLGFEEAAHPMFFPVIIFSHLIFHNVNLKHREARAQLREIERVVSQAHRTTPPSKGNLYLTEDGLVDFDVINLGISQCHATVLEKRPRAYLQIAQNFRQVTHNFHEKLPEERKHSSMRVCQQNLLSRINFLETKLESIESYAYTTLQRLDVQRSAIYMAADQINNRVGIQVAFAQKKLARNTSRDAAAQKTLALLGAIFLPGAYLSSVFSMTFFNWQPANSNGQSHVSPFFWIYWAVSLPLTVLVVGSFLLWQRSESRKSEEEDNKTDKEMTAMMLEAQNPLVARTRKRARTGDCEAAK